MKRLLFDWLSVFTAPFAKNRAVVPSPAMLPDGTLVNAGDIPLEGFGDPSAAIRFGYAVIVFGFGGFILWAMFAPIAEGVPAQGVVSVESRRKVVSHLTGGTVTSIHVQENQFVEAGAILLTLDATRAKATLDTMQNEYIATGARLARLIAEQSFANRIDFPPDVQKMATEMGRQDLLLAQEQLFVARQQAQEGEQAILRQSLATAGAQMAEARLQLTARSRQSDLLRQELAGNRQLAEDGYVSRNRLLEQERQLADLASTAADIQSRIATQIGALSESRLRLAQRRQEYLKEVETQSIEARKELANLFERLKDARLEMERTMVRAPVAGHVMALQAQAAGTIITAGMRLLEVVPSSEKLVFDVQIPIPVASRVSIGMETDIRLTVFPDIPQLIIDGRVQSISSDRHEQSQTAPQPYYLGRVEVTPEGMAKLGARQILPGMTAEIIIKTGERSFMVYLIRPFTRQFFSAFKEF